MFHLEVSGPGEVSGTLILPPGDKTYLVHCDIAQHMEKGMKGQLIVGKGSEQLPSIPGVTASIYPDDYSGKPYVPEKMPPSVSSTPSATPIPSDKTVATTNSSDSASALSGLTIIGLAIGFITAPMLANKFKGMSPAEIIAAIFELVSHSLGALIAIFSKLIKQFNSHKSISLPDK
jgi:hypothetical protein